MAEYDAIGDRYSEAKQAPWRLHLEAYTLERLAGDVRGAAVLDLACGDGFYSRRFMRRGAARVVGVDLSEAMIALARGAETAQPLGCRYQVGDAGDLGSIGAFDLVLAAYLLNYASTRDALRRLAAATFANLRPGGRLAAVNDYTPDARGGTQTFAAHGFTKHGPATDEEGMPVVYDFLIGTPHAFSVINYYWRPATYLETLREVGYREAAWHPFEPEPNARGPWDDLIAVSPCACLSAVR